MKSLRKLSVLLISLILIASLTVAQAADDSTQKALQKKKLEIMRVDEIQPGMTGTGKTVFGGPEPQTPENFNFIILPDRAKILYGIKDKKIILAILSGGRNNVIDKAGVIAGMSGSPCYIDGKLIGAVAYSFNRFATEALAGITPIEEMLELVTEKDSTPKAAIPSELKMPVFVSGLNQKALDFLEEKFKKSAPWIEIRPAFLGMDTGGSSASNLNLDLDDGDAISVALMVGDFNIMGTGTLTLRLNDIMWAFGHPFFWTGNKSNWPFFKADIATISSSAQYSYKLKAKIYPEQLGTLFIDDLTAIVGKLDRKDTMLPINVDILVKGGSNFEKRENFKVKIAQKNPYSDVLLFISMLNSIFVSSPDLKDTLVKLETQIRYYPVEIKVVGYSVAAGIPLPIIKVEKSKTEKTITLPQGFFLGKYADYDLYQNVYFVTRLFKFLEEAKIDIKDISCKIELTKNLTPRDAPILKLRSLTLNKYQGVKPGESLIIGLVLEDGTQIYGRTLIYQVPTKIGNREFNSGFLTIRARDFKTRLNELLAKDISKPENVQRVLSFIEKAKKDILYVEIELDQPITLSSDDRLREMGTMRVKWLAESKEKREKLTTTVEEILLGNDIPIEKIIDVSIDGFVSIAIGNMGKK